MWGILSVDWWVGKQIDDLLMDGWLELLMDGWVELLTNRVSS